MFFSWTITSIARFIRTSLRCCICCCAALEEPAEQEEQVPPAAPQCASGTWLVAIFSGLIFGIATGVIGPVLFYWENHPDGAFAKLSSLQQGIIAAAVLAGAALGAMAGGPFADWCGRKWALLITGALCATGSLGSSASPSLVIFCAARFVVGISVGTASTVAPLYISEMAPSGSRGRLVTLFQIAICTGILAAYGAGYGFNEVTQRNIGWRLMVSVSAVPGVALAVVCLFIPESQRWLAQRGEVSGLINETPTEAMSDSEEHYIPKKGALSLFSATNAPALLLACVLAIANQLTGINAIIYFAPHIMETAGLSSLAATIGVGGWNLGTTAIAAGLVDKWGRKPLICFGLLFQMLGLIAVVVGFMGLNSHPDVKPWVILSGIAVFIAGFEGGVGPLFFVVISEVFPQSVRGQAMGAASLVAWLLNLLVTFTFPLIAEGVVFCVFLGITVLCLCYAVLFVPETRGKQLENISV